MTKIADLGFLLSHGLIGITVTHFAHILNVFWLFGSLLFNTRVLHLSCALVHGVVDGIKVLVNRGVQITIILHKMDIIFFG